jgi:hypothetical protein
MSSSELAEGALVLSGIAILGVSELDTNVLAVTPPTRPHDPWVSALVHQTSAMVAL